MENPLLTIYDLKGNELAFIPSNVVISHSLLELKAGTDSFRLFAIDVKDHDSQIGKSVDLWVKEAKELYAKYIKYQTNYYIVSNWLWKHGRKGKLPIELMKNSIPHDENIKWLEWFQQGYKYVYIDKGICIYSDSIRLYKNWLDNCLIMKYKELEETNEISQLQMQILDEMVRVISTIIDSNFDIKQYDHYIPQDF